MPAGPPPTTQQRVEIVFVIPEIPFRRESNWIPGLDCEDGRFAAAALAWRNERVRARRRRLEAAGPIRRSFGALSPPQGRVIVNEPLIRPG